MSLVPNFTPDGLLPPGDAALTFDELRASTLVKGPGTACPNWDSEWRELASGRLERELNLLDPHKVWNWDPASRRPYRGYPKKQLPIWHVYRVELYPHFGQLCGITDRFGSELEFPSAFRLSRRDGKPRGIIKLVDGGSP